QRDFGENYVQELAEKAENLPADIRWHFIGHLQSNKVKYIAPFVHLIHGVDSAKLLQEIEKQGARNQRVIDCLLQIYIAKEETKFGLDEPELETLIRQAEEPGKFRHVRISGLMGMASFSDNPDLVRGEFKMLNQLYKQYTGRITEAVQFSRLSMGMSGDYRIALEEGTTMVRIGSLLFGARPSANY
ncbi:MAG: YggS family pyridoxal phosphate-dependent enzyme, partial [Chitinophagaceae bacterium]|nr:YggS family pyridoxal phosphate-dependent enzyme [Chitinophagaceae bacterium]